MPRSIVPRLLATGVVVTSATTVRVLTGCIDVWTRRTPTLARLTAGALSRDGGGRVEADLREEIVGLLRDSAEVSWRELRRGVDDFDALTRHEGDGGDDDEQIRRHRVKP